jgi:amidase
VDAAAGRPTSTVSAVSDDALGTDDVVALLGRLERREVSAAELREAAVARARAANDELNAVAWWVEPGVVPEPPVGGPLGGIPTLIKDNEDLAGYPSSQGSLAVADRPAASSSPWVSQYLSLGVVPIAKTTLPEFGLTASTESTRFGATANPWDTSRSAGGSSGGSSALVAAGVVPMAHANDGGGSIRIPAAINGIVGLKPSRGRLVDLPELEKLPVAITVQGVVTRTVRDTALYYAEAEKVYLNPALPPIGRVDTPAAPGLRIAMVTTSALGMPVSPGMVAAVRHAGDLLEGLGHHVEEIALPVDDRFGPDFLRYWAFLSFSLQYAGGRLYGEGFDGARTEQLTKGLASYFLRTAERLPGSLRRLRRLARDHEDVYGRYDVVLSPVLGHETPALGYLGPEVDVHTHLVRLLRYTSFTPLQNVSGSPGLSLPLARTPEGVPMGVHFGAAFGRERLLLELALALEEASPWPLTPAG